MPILAGIDEAGYGPKLGPLVVTATAFEGAVVSRHADMWDLLKGAVCRGRRDGDGIVVADSKVLFSNRNMAPLEETALAVLGAVTGPVRSLPQLRRAVCHLEASDWDRYPWYARAQLRIPVQADAAVVEDKSRRLSGEMEKRGVRLLMIESIAVRAGTFNRLLRETDNKAVVLFAQVAKLVNVMGER